MKRFHNTLAMCLWSAIIVMVHGSPSFAENPPVLSLEQAMVLAHAQNLQLRQAEQAVMAAKGLASQSRAIARPELSVTWTGIPSGLSFGLAEEREIGLSQALEFPGKRLLRSRIGDRGVDVADLQLVQLRVRIQAEVKQFYYAALAPQTEMAHLQSVRDLLSGFLESTLTKYQGGEIPFVEVLRFKVELAQLDNDLIEVKRRLALRLRELNLLLGQPPDTQIVLADQLAFTPFSGELEEIQTEALRQSRTLQIVQAATDQSNQRLRLARMGYAPDFRIGAFAFNARGPGNDGWTAEAGLEIPLWSWWEQKGKIQEARAMHETQLIQQAAVERAIRGTVTSAFERVKATEAQVTIFQRSLLTDTGDALQSAITEYQFNRINALSLLDIYRTYKTTQIEFTRALMNYQTALAELKVAAELPMVAGLQGSASTIQTMPSD